MQQVYRPPPTVERFMRSDTRFRLIMGPFGSGKSSGCCVEIAHRAKQQKPGRDHVRRSRWAVVRNTLPQLRDTTLKTWFDWFPNGVAGAWVETTKTFNLRFDDVHAEVMFRPLDTPDDVAKLLSLELTGAYVNEAREIPKEIVDGLDGRIGRFPAVSNGGCTWRGIFGDTNPPEEDSWWHRMFEKIIPNRWDVFKQPSGLSPHAENIENLDPGYYQNLAEGKDPEWVKVYVHGEYGTSKSGKPVHPTFNSEIHVAKQPLTPNRHLIAVVAADFGLTPAVVIKQQDAFGRVLTLDEIVTGIQGMDRMGLRRLIQLKLKPLLRNKYDDVKIVVTGDPAGASAAQTDERSCVDIFREEGFKRVKFAWSNNPIHRIGATDHFLTRMTEVASGFLIDPRCPFYIRGLKGGYRYKVSKDGITSESVDKSDYSHICEAGQYADMYFERGVEGRVSERQRNEWLQQVNSQAGIYTMRM